MDQQDEINMVKSIIKEELTDQEALDLIQKRNKVRECEKLGKPYLTFDWGAAIMLIVGHKIKNAAFGLHGDWKASSAIGLRNGQPTEPIDASKFGYCLTSNWATPQLRDLDKDIFYDCYRTLNQDEMLKHSSFGYEPWWPEDAKLSFDFVKEIWEDLQC